MRLHLRQNSFGKNSLRIPRSLVDVAYVHTRLTYHHRSTVLGVTPLKPDEKSNNSISSPTGVSLGAAAEGPTRKILNGPVQFGDNFDFSTRLSSSSLLCSSLSNLYTPKPNFHLYIPSPNAKHPSTPHWNARCKTRRWRDSFASTETQSLTLPSQVAMVEPIALKTMESRGTSTLDNSRWQSRKTP